MSDPLVHQTDPVAAARRRRVEYVAVFATIAAVTAVGWFAPLSYGAIGYVYLLALVALSLRFGRWPVFAGAVLSAVVWDFVFLPPPLIFSTLHFDDTVMTAITYTVVALISTQLAALRTADQQARLLAESERLHQTLLDSVTHELKTPIAVFRSAVEQLGTGDARKREVLTEEIRTATQRLDELVDNLLSQNRLESGVLKARMDWCDAHELVAAARRSVESRLAGRPLMLSIPADFPIFRADPALTEQALAQLLLNAAVHTPAGRPVRISAALGPGAASIRLSVSDEGPGIPEELRGRIFEKFQRGPSARSGGGLGLGLSIVRGFMVAQGGSVSLDSPPGGGARFTLSLPHAPERPAPPE